MSSHTARRFFVRTLSIVTRIFCMFACPLWVAMLFLPVVKAETAWKSVITAIDPADAVAGEWTKTSTTVHVNSTAGARLPLRVQPTEEYDFRVTFTRHSGVHSIAVIVVHGGKQCAFEADAWGQHLGGFQNINGRDIRDNPTRRERVSLVNGRQYTMTVEVRRERIRGFLDDQEIANYQTTGSDLSLSDLWRMPPGSQLAIAAWKADTTFHSVDIRPVGSSSVKMSASVKPTSPIQPVVPTATTHGKRVLIVIANQDFFYREYSEPRQELERAGIKVSVAAGRKSVCRPHQGTGEGADGGAVTPDLAIADVRATEFDAILFSGGWGSSMYQFAFNGRYNNPIYNGDRETKAQVNRVINEFIAADKYVCALCNAVSVLAWARVDGRSPLQGKRVCAPTREAAPGIYNGRAAQPSCRWHPEMNGAILSPPGAIGVAGSPHDDVLVDGKIITGEDDPSAREMGRRIVSVLSTD